MVAGLADLVIQAYSPSEPQEFQADEVIALPGPCMPGVHEDLTERSWHLFHQGQQLRAIEASPLSEPEGEAIRARRAWVMESPVPWASPALALWTSADVRFWRGGMHPLLDAPLSRGELSPQEKLILDHLGDEPVEDAVTA